MGPFVLACRPALAGQPGPWPLVVFTAAALTDFFDGRVARRAGGASRAGQVLDSVADILFVGTALLLFAAVGRISWLVPVAVAGAVAAYVRDSWRRARSAGAVELDRTTVGHAAGVLNYVLVGFVAGELAFPALRAGVSIGLMVDGVAATTLGANALALFTRLWPRSRAAPQAW